jgi:hypothetical protein
MTHRGIISKITRQIISELKYFMSESNLVEGNCEIPYEEDYYTIKIYGQETSFYIDLYIFKTEEDNYKIDADAPASIDEDDIRVIIYANPKNYLKQLSEIYFNLIYTLRHEFEHFLQVQNDYKRIKPSCYNHKRYRGDSLSTLLKPQEIEPQVIGYHFQSKKQNKSFLEILNYHLNQMEKNGQITFKSDNRKQILVDTLTSHAKELNLKILR